MGFLNKLKGLVGGSQKGSIADVVQALVDQFGGIQPLVEKLQSSGLSSELSTWVETGDNSPVSPARIEEALGSEAITGVAQRLGIEKKEAAAKTAVAVPRVIDRLTPAGKLPEGGISIEAVANLLGRLRER